MDSSSSIELEWEGWHSCLFHQEGIGSGFTTLLFSFQHTMKSYEKRGLSLFIGETAPSSSWHFNIAIERMVKLE
jgi:hypothetical protein